VGFVGAGPSIWWACICGVEIVMPVLALEEAAAAAANRRRSVRDET
jgi:hypothetical protein